jgi:hypothetical protein
MSIIRVEDVNSSLDKLKEEGCIDPAYIENCKNWVYTKSIMWPDQMVSITRPATLITNDIQDNLPIISSFKSFKDFKRWYSRFFIRTIKRTQDEISEETLRECGKLERALRKVAPNDPLIYPLSEEPLDEERLGMKTRTTRTGGMLSFVTAELPRDFNVQVVAKKVPEERLLEQEKKIHDALRGVGYTTVTECITTSSYLENQVLTYGRLAGDLRGLRGQPDHVRKKYILRSLNTLMDISLDIDYHINPEVSFDSREMACLCDVVDENIRSDKEIVGRFVRNYFFRVAVASEGFNQSENRDELKPFLDVMLLNKSDSKIPQGLKEKYPKLAAVTTDKSCKERIVNYWNLVRSINQLDKFPGHDDFTVNNILAKEIYQSGENNIGYQGLQLHDVGLVYAPFQNYIFDIAVSSGASPALQSEIVNHTYRQLRDSCINKGIKFEQSLTEFEKGYRLVAISKNLTQASLRFMDLKGGSK